MDDMENEQEAVEGTRAFGAEGPITGPANPTLAAGPVPPPSGEADRAAQWKPPWAPPWTTVPVPLPSSPQGDKTAEMPAGMAQEAAVPGQESPRSPSEEPWWIPPRQQQPTTPPPSPPGVPYAPSTGSGYGGTSSYGGNSGYGGYPPNERSYTATGGSFHGSPPSGPGGYRGASPGGAGASTSKSRRRGLGAIALLLVAALIGAGVGAGVVAAGASSKTTVVKEVAPGPALVASNTSIRTILAKVQPAVVTIVATVDSAGGVPGPFGLGGSAGTIEDEGTGMIISPNGLVVTNNHVIAGATTIQVTLYGRTTALPATVVGTDVQDDIAVIRIKGVSHLPTVKFGDSSTVQVGDAVVAIGNALGLGGAPTVTQGIISGVGRSIQAGDPTTGTVEDLTGMLQTDAPINPGNSGGPLVDSAGQVIGMNTAAATSASGNAPAQDVGFAIPSNRITALLAGIESGKYTKAPGAFMGVSVTDNSPQIQAEFGLAVSTGAVVVEVIPNTPAFAAGLQPGDVIVGFNGKPISSATALTVAVRNAHPGETVPLQIYRGAQKVQLTITLGQAPVK